MTHVDALEIWFKDGMSDLWRNVRAMPEDKLDWKLVETSRSARELMEEIVSVMPYNVGIMKEQKAPEMSWDDSGVKKSIDLLEEEFTKSAEEFFNAAREFPEDKLQDKVELPWGTFTFISIMSYPYWNLMYHVGQIAYIQTQYGDKDMH